MPLTIQNFVAFNFARIYDNVKVMQHLTNPPALFNVGTGKGISVKGRFYDNLACFMNVSLSIYILPVHTGARNSLIALLLSHFFRICLSLQEGDWENHFSIRTE